MREQISKVLKGFEIDEKLIPDILDYISNQPNGDLTSDKQGGSSGNSLAIDVLIMLTFDLSSFRLVARELLDNLFTRENQLTEFDKGRLYHIKAYLDWKVGNDIYSSCNGLNRSIKIFKRITSVDSELYLARVHDTYGQILKGQGLLNDARHEYETSLLLKENSDDFYGKSITLGNLGRLNLELGNFWKAIDYLQKDLDIVVKDIKSDNLLAQLLNTIAICLIEVNDNKTAEDRLKESFELNKNANNSIGICFNYLAYVSLFQNLDRIPDCFKYLNKVEDLLRNETIPKYLVNHIKAESLKLKAQVYFHAGRLEESEKLYQSAIESYCESMSFSPVEKAKLLYGYADLLLEKNDQPKAHQFYRKALQQLDTTEANDRREKIEDKLMQLNKDSWVLHSAGRFIGHHQIDQLLDETGKEGFRGKHQFAAVLFCDITDFTSISEKFNPNELIQFLNDFFRLMTRSIEHFNGFVDKFIGDAIMAVFVAKNNSPDEQLSVAHNACMAALMMNSELDRFNRKKEHGIPEISVSTGIHAGDSVAGLIGSPQKRSYTFMGDTVNTASRLEGMAKLLGAGIVLSEQVYKLLQSNHLFLLRPLGKFLPKGKEQALTVVELMGLDDNTSYSSSTQREIKEAQKHILNFQKREFSKAVLGYENLYDEYAHSPRAKGYDFLIAKSKSMMIDPPKENWDGSIRLYSK